MLLSLKDICKTYYTSEQPVPVLYDINFEMEQGEYAAIMGPSGSGKSTLMNIIGYLDVPTSGTYLFEGEDNAGAGDGRMAEIRNEKIGFVFQSFHLLKGRRAWENVALPLQYRGVPRKLRKELALESLDKVGLADRAEFYPNQMSGGQCQRVAIARAMVTEPRLLLADEPTGALDSKSGEQIMEIFDGLHMNGVSILMITHELSVAERADRLMHIYDGRLKEGL